MTPEEVALRFARSRAGYQLIGYAEVGLPIYELTIQAETLAYKRISPLDEFTLRSIQAGLNRLEDISAFLGISRNVAEGVLSDLIRSDDLILAGGLDDISQSLKLTPKGRRSIEEAEQTVPEERTFQIHFDGLLRKPLLTREYLYSPKELEQHGWLEIPSIPSVRPELPDLSVEDVQDIIRRAARHTRETRRDILSIKSIFKRYRKFLPAIGLRYRSNQGDTVVAFAVDGRLSDEHEKAFARGEGIRKMKLKPSGDVGFDDIAKEIETLLLASGISVKDVSQLQGEYDAAASALAEARLAVGGPDANQESSRQEQLERVSRWYEAAAEALNTAPVRSLSVYEHPPTLEKALTEATGRLMIISPWIRSSVVNHAFLNKIELLLKQNVAVYIGYGIGDKKFDKQAVDNLTELAKNYMNFHFKEFGDTHAKLLLYDQACVVLGSFNWLSFRGDPTATFRDEQSFMVRIPKVIEEKFAEQVSRF